MSTGYETILANVETRLTTPSDFVPGTYGTRRGHLVPITRAKAPGAHIVGGDDDPVKGSKCGARQAEFTVSIFTRGDDGSADADPYILTLYARMNDPSNPWPAGVAVFPAGIHRETEIADEDAARTDCVFRVEYRTQGEWSLELQA